MIFVFCVEYVVFLLIAVRAFTSNVRVHLVVGGGAVGILSGGGRSGVGAPRRACRLGWCVDHTFNNNVSEADREDDPDGSFR